MTKENLKIDNWYIFYFPKWTSILHIIHKSKTLYALFKFNVVSIQYSNKAFD